MRLWHSDLIKFLPKGQLLSQWRELNSIFAKENRHILINFVYEYPKEDLYVYTQQIMKEFKKRRYNIRTFDKMNNYFADLDKNEIDLDYWEYHTPFENHFNKEYLEICYYNLKEKFIRGQKDYEEKMYHDMHDFVEVLL